MKTAAYLSVLGLTILMAAPEVYSQAQQDNTQQQDNTGQGYGGGGGRRQRNYQNNNGGGNNNNQDTGNQGNQGGNYGGGGGGRIRNNFNNGGGNNGGGGFNQGGFNQGGGGRRNRNFGNNPYDPTAGNFTSSNQGDDVPIPTPPPMANTYLTLTSRSIFFKGFFVPQGTAVAADVRPPTPLEQVLVFWGTSDTDGELTAFFENSEDSKITMVHEGDPIASGKVKTITLDTIDYSTGITIAHLNIGQNLHGDQIYGGLGTPASMPTIDMSGPGGDLLRKMALRRLQEMNGTTPAATPGATGTVLGVGAPNNPAVAPAAPAAPAK